jgi:hypothetical protein
MKWSYFEPQTAGIDEEGKFSISRGLPRSAAIYSFGVLIITCPDFIERVRTFIKNYSVVCFIPHNGVPYGFLIIVGRR